MLWSFVKFSQFILYGNAQGPIWRIFIWILWFKGWNTRRCCENLRWLMYKLSFLFLWNCNLFSHEALKSSWELVEMCPCIPDWIGIWKCWFLSRGENQSTRRKTSWSKEENQQQTQPTYGIDARFQTQATLVGGECSHHCPTLALVFITFKNSPSSSSVCWESNNLYSG